MCVRACVSENVGVRAPSLTQINRPWSRGPTDSQTGILRQAKPDYYNYYIILSMWNNHHLLLDLTDISPENVVQTQLFLLVKNKDYILLIVLNPVHLYPL